MNYQCARAIKVQKVDDETILKQFADYDRKGLTSKDWQKEMFHELEMTKIANKIINAPHIYSEDEHHFYMTYCGEAVLTLNIDDFICIKNMERDLIHYGELYHNDIKTGNILLKDNEFYLIDYGHATVGDKAFPYFNHLHLIDFKMPEVQKELEMLINKILRETNAHGGNVSYYGLGGEKGIRDWAPRWEILKNACDYRGKRILDLGCNQGLFVTCIAREFEPRFVLGVDASPDIIKAANYFAIKNGVDSYFKHLNLANGDKRNPHFTAHTDWQDVLGYNFDIVSALSLYHWVQNKQELLDYLFNFNEVLMECHGLQELEELINKFQDKGYTYEIVLSGSDEKYDRPIVKFIRS